MDGRDAYPHEWFTDLLGPVDEIRKPQASVLGELRGEPHDIAVGAVVQSQRQQVEVTGDAAQRR